VKLCNVIVFTIQGIDKMFTALTTEFVIKFFDNLFDGTNCLGRHPYNGKPYLASITEKSEHLQLFQESRKFIEKHEI